MTAISDEITQGIWIRALMGNALPIALKLRRQISTLLDNNVQAIHTKERMLREADEAMEVVKLGADLLICLTLSNSKSAQTIADTLGMEFLTLITGYQDGRNEHFTEAGWAANRATFIRMRAEVDALLKWHKPFHWPLEFPEVFVGKGDDAGFAAIVSNPPFQGGQKITGALGTDYRDFLIEHLANRKRGSADLCAYFFLRTTHMVRKEGMCALLATNTIAQGDTREVGLDQITASGWTIPRAIPSRKWPGEASLEVAHVWLRNGAWHRSYVLNDVIVENITSFLTPPGKIQGQPYPLIANANKSFQGVIVLGTGFLLTSEEAYALIEKDLRNKDVLFPYLNGEDLNTRPDQSPSRWVINFQDWPLEKAEMYSDCIKIIREKVKPERDRLATQKDVSARNSARFWWQFRRKGQALYSAIADMKRVLVIPRVSKYLICHWEPVGIVYSEATCIIASSSNTIFALIQCTFHSDWTRANGSSLRNDQRYTPSDCFETFPFPTNTAGLDDIGERYYTHRQSIMLARQEGLTKTYNRFHDDKERSQDIVKLRELHKEMDEAVAHAYGWDDLRLEHGFHQTKQGVRYTISEAARREALDRLLLLNHQRHEEEVKAGLWEKGTKAKAKGKKGVEVKGKKEEEKDMQQGMLF